MDAGMSFYGGIEVDPTDYLMDNPPRAYWQGLQDIAPGASLGQDAPQHEVPDRPVRREQPTQGRSPLQIPSFASVFTGLTSGFMRHYPKLFMIVILPSSLVALGSLLLSGNQPQDAAINTPLSAQTRQNVYESAVAIVLDQPIQTAEGVRPATAAEILDAGRRVMGEMESQLLQRKVNEWAIAITLGLATPGHPCYQLTQQQCVALQQRALDERWQAATQVGDTDELLLVSNLNRALDRMREGRTEPHQWQQDLWRFARVKYLAATQQVDAQTPNGIANTLLKMQQQSAQQAGMQFNPQTGQLEPVQ